MTVAKLIEELNLIEAGMMVLENIDLDEQSVAMTRKSLKHSLCCYKELREKRKNYRVKLQCKIFSHAQRLEKGKLEKQ